MAEVVDASGIHERLASITPCEDFLTLVVSQFRLAPNNAPSFGAFPAFTGGCGSIPAQTQQAGQHRWHRLVSRSDLEPWHKPQDLGKLEPRRDPPEGAKCGNAVEASNRSRVGARIGPRLAIY